MPWLTWLLVQSRVLARTLAMSLAVTIPTIAGSRFLELPTGTACGQLRCGRGHIACHRDWRDGKDGLGLSRIVLVAAPGWCWLILGRGLIGRGDRSRVRGWRSARGVFVTPAFSVVSIPVCTLCVCVSQVLVAVLVTLTYSGGGVGPV